MRITDYRVDKLVLPCDPPISNCRKRLTAEGVVYLRLDTDTGTEGIGLGRIDPEYPFAELRREFESIGERLIGESPFGLCNRFRLPGQSTSPERFTRAVDVALWDLCGRHLDVPIYELLGGENPETTAYASGCAYAADDGTTRELYEEFAAAGFDVAKVKVGYPTVEEDVERMGLVRDVLGDDCTLAVDANLAWSAKEAITRARAYRDAGFDVCWIEDPVHYDRLGDLERVVENVPRCYVNSGEYVGVDRKRVLLEHGAVDMLNLRRGLFSESLAAATMALSHGVKLHVGDVPGELGVHLAAALPGDVYLEYWKRPWDLLTDGAVGVEDGTLVAPDRPGHGVTVSDEALETYGETSP